jgi:CO/xanthine dehydrogenase FAD-binding subunit
MIRDRFAYHAPHSLEEATALLAEVGERATVLGGGTWVVPEMARGIRRPAHVVDLRRLDLAGTAAQNGHVTIGPRTTYAQLEAAAEVPPLLRTMAKGITGGAQIRNQGTIGGSACYANPGSDVPGALVALDATLTLASAGGDREVAAGDFFRGAYATDRRPDEVLTAIRVARVADGARQAYVKFKLVEGSWPIVTASCVTGEDGVIRSLVIGGAAGAPVQVDVSDGEDVAQRVVDAVVEPWSDALAPGEYRKVISGVIAKRAVLAAREGSEGEVK